MYHSPGRDESNIRVRSHLTTMICFLYYFMLPILLPITPPPPVGSCGKEMFSAVPVTFCLFTKYHVISAEHVHLRTQPTEGLDQHTGTPPPPSRTGKKESSWPSTKGPSCTRMHSRRMYCPLVDHIP